VTTLITALDDSYAHAAKVIAGVDVGQLTLPTPVRRGERLVA
jgi:hypothetical protein